MTMRFEKWQALGNDYLIVERDELPVRAHARRASAGCASRTSACSPTGCCCSRRRPSPGTSPTCGSSTPTARRPSCRATARARRSSTCAAAAGPTRDELLDRDRRRRDPPDDHRPRHVPRRHGPRAPRPPQTSPAARPTAAAASSATGHEWAFRHVSIGNPQCAIRVATPSELRRSTSPAIGPPIEADRPVSRTAPTSPGTPSSTPGGRRIRARIFERGVGETLSSGTGASGAAVAYVSGTRRAASARRAVDGRARRRRAARSRWGRICRCT